MSKFMDGKDYVVLQGGENAVKPLSEFNLVDETLLASGKIFVGSAAGKAADVTPTGDVTISNTGVTAIGDGKVTASQVEALADGEILVGVDGTAANNAKVTVTGDITMTNAGVTAIGDGKVTASQVEALTAGQFIIGFDGDAANNTKVTMSGDATMDNTGAVTVSKLATNKDKINDLIDYLADGLWVHGDMAVCDAGAPEKFMTQAIAAYTVNGITYTKGATKELVFSHDDTITAPAATGSRYGGWVIQINADGTVSTLAETGQSGVVDMAYESAADALAGAKAITLTAANTALGYVVVSQVEDGMFTANTDTLAAVSTFTNDDVKSLPAKLA